MTVMTLMMLGHWPVGREDPRLGLEEILIYLRAGREAAVLVLVEVEATVVWLRGDPELQSWLQIQEDHLNESSSRQQRPENESLYSSSQKHYRSHDD